MQRPLMILFMTRSRMSRILLCSAALVLATTLSGCRPLHYLATALEISRAEKLHENGNLPKAVHHIEKAIQLDSGGPWGELAAYRLGELYLECNLPSEALKSFKNALKSFPGHLEDRRAIAHLKIGECYEALNDPMEALEYYHSLLQDNPHLKEDVLICIGRVEQRLERTGKREDIEHAFRDYKDYYKQYLHILGGQIHMFDPFLGELAFRKFKESYNRYKSLVEEMSRQEKLDKLRFEAQGSHERYLNAIKGLSPEEYNRPDINSLREQWEEQQREFEIFRQEIESLSNE